MPEPGALILRRGDVSSLLSLQACIAAVEKALISHARGQSLPPGVLGVHVPGGGFHMKAAGQATRPGYFAAKLNANFPGNPESHGLPVIQGVVLLCDAETGSLLAILDSIEITILRTGAASALAADRLALPHSSTAGILGCGNQGKVHLRAFASIRALRRAAVWDIDASRATSFCEAMSRELAIPVTRAESPAAAARQADLIATCTPSREPLLRPGDVAPGAFIAAVGADNPQKHEIDPRLLASCAVVVDSLEQCAAFGDLAHALRAGEIRLDQVRGELPDVIAGLEQGRRSEEEILLFDSTGTGLLDLAASVAVYERAAAAGPRLRVDFQSEAAGPDPRSPGTAPTFA